jgi:hypothetical protein
MREINRACVKEYVHKIYFDTKLMMWNWSVLTNLFCKTALTICIFLALFVLENCCSQ